MNLRLFVLERWIPPWMRRRMLRDLAALTAEAFGSDVPHLAGLRRDRAISVYAAFTRGEVERATARADNADAGEIRARLYESAREMGRAARRDLGVTSRAGGLRALRALYRGIGIDLDIGPDTGDIAVRRCAFSRTYTPAVCAFISALDAGFLDGLTGGSTLVFSERITEGASRCRARLTAASHPRRDGALP